MTRKTLGKYEIIERIGRGGMAEVYRGYHAALDRYVAIKLLHPFLADDPEFKDRFEKEAKNVAKLRHPNVVQVFDFEYDADGDSYYMVMEMVDGPTLKDRLFELAADNRRYSIIESARIMIDTANALAYAHKRNMIHRDVKPANLMLDEDGRVVLTDFGIAKIVTSAQFTASGGMIGTPAYMAPEQGLGEAGDERSDIYSLGVIFYQMVTGRLPYDADTPLAVILKHVNDPLPDPRIDNPDLPDWVVASIQRSLEKNSEDRYQTSKEFLEDLKRGQRTERGGETNTGFASIAPTSSVMTKAQSGQSTTRSQRSVLDPTRKRITQTIPLDAVSVPVQKETTSSQKQQRAATQSKEKQTTGEKIAVALLSFVLLFIIGAGFVVAGQNDIGPLASWFDTVDTETPQQTSVVAIDASNTPTPIISTTTPTPSLSPTPSPNATETAFITQTVEAKSSATSSAETALAIVNITETAVAEETLSAVTATPSPSPTDTPNLTETSQAIQAVTQTAVAQETAQAVTPTLTARGIVEACDLDYVIIEPDNLDIPPRLNDARNPRLVRASNATTDTEFSFTLIIENASTCDWPLDGELALAFIPDTEDLEIDYEPLAENCQLSSDRLFTDINFTQPQRPRFFFDDIVRNVRRTEQIELEITGVAPRNRGCHFGVWQLEFTDYDQYPIGEPIIMGIQVFSGQ